MRRTRIGGIARICVRFAVDLRPNCGCLRTFFARFAVVCRRGVAPIDDVLLREVRLHLSIALESKLSSLCIRFALTLPLQGAILFKRSCGGGTQGAVHFVHFTLG